MLKKIIILFMIFILTGCMEVNNPSKKVALFLNRYQMLDNIVVLDIEKEADTYNFEKSEKEDYINLIKKQYQSFSYRIKDIKINEDKASVKVEINVLDYKNANKKIDNYYNNISNNKKIKYKLKEMSKVGDYRKENINVNLVKIDNEWIVQNLDVEDMKKLQGID